MTAATPEPQEPEETPTPAAPDAGAGAEAVPDLIDQVSAIAQQRHDQAIPELAAVAVALADTLELVDAGQAKASPVERAFLVGALSALRGALMAKELG